ncbi:conserved Plasmodium protein, unknown function [Plasmodium gallinaceum]|uniref:Uncharacterized protein n=1 Tax=Plasmodium gallinaceum TaxID=5849 RepID=A0A1J1GUL1_PLAGA|nr:conserved Plasmodium protein, unknown function [Plasmodium gallinaceum]CRG96199.1 conserved Plasmodium protein, unknown function [Plasmodium gallinaceum]
MNENNSKSLEKKLTLNDNKKETKNIDEKSYEKLYKNMNDEYYRQLNEKKIIKNSNENFCKKYEEEIVKNSHEHLNKLTEDNILGDSNENTYKKVIENLNINENIYKEIVNAFDEILNRKSYENKSTDNTHESFSEKINVNFFKSDEFLDDFNRNFSEQKSSTSTLSLFSSNSDDSSIFEDKDNLINIYIGQIKLYNILNNSNFYENVFCVSYFAYEDPMETFSLFQGINWLPELKNRCTFLSSVEYLPKKNVKINSVDVGININQYINLKNRKNEYLNIIYNDIIYVFISIVGVNLKEFENYYSKKISKKYRKVNFKDDSLSHKMEDNSHTIHEDINNKKTLDINEIHIKNNKIHNEDMGEEELIKEIRSEIEDKMRIIGNKKIIQEKDYKDYLKILGSSIIPISIEDEHVLEKKSNWNLVNIKNNYNSYNVYSHNTIRTILNNYLDAFKINKKVDLFHLINEYENELIPIGKIKLLINVKNKTNISIPNILNNKTDDIKSDSSNVNKMINRILNYEKINKNTKKDNISDNDINEKYLNINKDTEKETNSSRLENKESNIYFNRIFNYIEKNLNKIYDEEEENILRNELFKTIFSKLELSKKKEKKLFLFNEIVCSHLIVFVHYISRITLNLSILKNFVHLNNFYLIIYWDEEGDTMENIEKIKLRKSRIMELNTKKDIELDYYFLTHNENDLKYKMNKKDNIVNLKLNFNSCVILPYNHNIYPHLNIILFHNDIPLLELAEKILINDKTPFNDGVKIKKKLKVHEDYKHKAYNFLQEKFSPYIELSFYKHPKNSKLLSYSNYRLYYKEKMKCNIDNYIHLSYSAPKFNKENIFFLFFDDFANGNMFNESKCNTLDFFKNDFFLPVIENEKKTLESSRKSEREKKNNENMLLDIKEKSNSKKNNNYLPLIKNDIIDFAIAEGPGLKGGEINKWLSFNVYTKNYKKKNIYCGEFVNIRLQVEPFGFLKSEYDIYPYKNNEVNKSTVNCYKCNKKLMGSEHFCFKLFYDIHETVDYKIEDLKNGVYNILYKVSKVGKKFLYIYCDGINIIGSPYEINIFHSTTDPKSSKILGEGATRCLGTPIINIENFSYNEKSNFLNVNNCDNTNNISYNSNIQSKLLQEKIDEFERIKMKFENKIVLASDNKEKFVNKNNSYQSNYSYPNNKEEKQIILNEQEEKKEISNNCNEKKHEGKQNVFNEIEHKNNEINNSNNIHPFSIDKDEENSHINMNSEENQKTTSNVHEDILSERKNYVHKENLIFSNPEYYDEINGNIIKLDKINNEKYKNFLRNIEVINNFTVVLCDQYGERVSIGNENIKVIGKNGAYIKNVIDNNDGSYTIEYISYVKKEKKKNFGDIKKEEILNFYNEFLFQENKYYDNYIIKEFEKRFSDLPIYCEINVYVNEVEIFGSPLKPIIMNIHNIIELYNLYDQFTYSGLLLKNFEYLLDSKNYQACIDNLCEFYNNMVDVEDIPSFKNLLPNIIHDNNIENENFFFKIPLNISELKKGAFIENKLPINKLSWKNIKKYKNFYKSNLNEEKNMYVHENDLNNKTFLNNDKTGDDILNYGKNNISNKYENDIKYKIGSNLCHNINYKLITNNTDDENTDFLNKWLYMYTHREKLSNLNNKYDLGMNLAYSLSNIILHHLIYLKKYKYFVNFKQYENDLLQNNILTQFKKILEEEYNKMFAYQTNNIIKYCNKIGNAKFNSLENLIKVYKGIAYELRKLKKNELANDFDKCCEYMCEELYLGNIESNLKRKEALLNKYEKIMNEKIEKVDKIKNSLKKYDDKKVDLEKISKLCIVKTNKEVQTNDYLSYKTGFLSSLIESRKETNDDNIIDKKIVSLVRKSWKNSSTYDIYTTIPNTLKNCPRLKIALEETFNYYSCSFRKNSKIRDLEFKKMQEIKNVDNVDNLKKIELQEENFLSYNDLNDSYLTYNAYFSLINDLKCNKYFINDLDNVLWLFEKFSIEHSSFKNLYNPYGLLRVIPKYLFIAFIRELSYLNLLYVLAQLVVENNENSKLYLTINHPSRLSSFHHFIKYHFIHFYDKLCNLDNFQNFKLNLIELNDVIEETTQNNTSADDHINLLELENYFNNELPLIVKHKNFSKTFPLLFEYYSKLSMNQNKTCDKREINNKKKTNEIKKSETKEDMDLDKEKKEDTDVETESYQNSTDNKYISISIFIRILREFGLIPHFFDNNVVKQILNSSMKNKKKLNYDDFSYAIILSICECVKKNIMTQYNMLRTNKCKNSKIQAEKILNYNYVVNEVKELIYLFGFSDINIVKSKISI